RRQGGRARAPGPGRGAPAPRGREGRGAVFGDRARRLRRREAPRDGRPRPRGRRAEGDRLPEPDPRRAGRAWMRWALLAAPVVEFMEFMGACSGDDNTPCLPDPNLGCKPNLQCETVQGRSAPTCLAPVVVTGKVFDISTHGPVSGARVVLENPSGVALAAAGTTAADGSYAIRIHAPRDANLVPISQKLSVEAEAPGYGTFPDRWRPAGQVDALSAQANADRSQLILASAETNVFLLPFGGGPGIGVVSG